MFVHRSAKSCSALHAQPSSSDEESSDEEEEIVVPVKAAKGAKGAKKVPHTPPPPARRRLRPPGCPVLRSRADTTQFCDPNTNFQPQTSQQAFLVYGPRSAVWPARPNCLWAAPAAWVICSIYTRVIIIAVTALSSHTRPCVCSFY